MTEGRNDDAQRTSPRIRRRSSAGDLLKNNHSDGPGRKNSWMQIWRSMENKKRMASVFRRAESPNLYALLIDPRTSNGYRRVSTGVSDQRQAEEIAQRLQEELDRQREAEGGLTFIDAAEEYINNGGLKDSTRKGYVSLTKQIVENENLGDFNLKLLTLEDIRSFVRDRRADTVKVHNGGKSSKRVSDATIKRALSFMSAVIAYAIDRDLEGAPEKNVVKEYDRSRLKDSKIIDRHISAAMFRQIIDKFEKEGGLEAELHIRILTVLVGTGLRTGEFCSLEWEQIDFENSMIEIGYSGFTDTKTSRSRRIPMLKPVREALITQWEVSNKPTAGYCFPSRVSGEKRTDLSYLRNRVKKLSGLDQFRIHDLRHTFASWAVQQGVDPLAIQKVLGHSTLATTQRYAHHVSDSVLAQFDKIQMV